MLYSLFPLQLMIISIISYFHASWIVQFMKMKTFHQILPQPKETKDYLF